MSEKDLNIEFIKNKTGLIENDELIPIILEMIKDSYRSGLCQSEFDNTMCLIEENQELKKQLEEKNKPQIFIDTQDMEERYAEGLYQDYLEEENKKYKDQQKEFISYLENMLDNENDIFSVVRVKDILSKYKEIIGGKE